ncbi:MAG: protein kinase [Cyanobacteria bacterium]|nr:protein kinase [Cyanobacteriota bacterium]
MNAKTGLSKETCRRCDQQVGRSASNKLTGWLFSAGGKGLACQCPEQVDLDIFEPTPATDPNPRAFDFGSRYEVEERLGSGGMATVFRVRDTEIGARFALKVFSEHPDEIEGMQKRLERESRTLMELTHANIGAAFGDGKTADGYPYLILDWIEGKTLAQLIEEGAMTEKRSVSLFLQIAEALQHAHLKGIVHKDLKPSNIVVSQDEYGNDCVKVIDFGIATVLKADDDTAGTGADGLGTPLYMSPEQSRGDKIDGRTDIYSLGCVMYEVLTGVPPFTADTAVKVILKHLKEKPRPIRSYAGKESISDELEKLVMQCLEKEPSRRYQLVDEVVQDLVNVQDGRERQFHFSNLKPSPARRLMASIVDGLILSIVFLAVRQVLAIVFQIPDFGPLALGPGNIFFYALIFPVVSAFIGPAASVLFITFLCSLGKIGLDWVCQYSSLFVTIAFCSLYYGWFESSRFQATPGKLLFNLAVVDSKGGRLTFGRSILRQLSRLLYYRIATLESWTINKIKEKNRQSIHDRWQAFLKPSLLPGVDDLAGAHVVKRIALNAPHELHLCESLDFLSFSLEQLYWLKKAVQTTVGVSLIFLALIAIIAWSEIMSGKPPVLAMLFLVAYAVVNGAEIFLFFKTRRLIKDILKLRHEDRSKRPSLEDVDHSRVE